MFDPIGILLMPVGNHFHDSGLFKECEHFLRCEHSMTEKIMVLNMLLTAMGEPETANEGRVAAYIAFVDTL